MKMSPLSNPFHLSPSSFPSSWNLSVSIALLLSLVMMLTGSNAFRVLREKDSEWFWRMGNQHWGVWSGKYSTLFIFLQRLFLSVTQICVVPKSVVRLCVHLFRCVSVAFSTPEATVVFSLAFSLFLFFLSSSHRAALSLLPRRLRIFTGLQICAMRLNLPWGGRTLTGSIVLMFSKHGYN